MPYGRRSVEEISPPPMNQDKKRQLYLQEDILDDADAISHLFKMRLRTMKEVPKTKPSVRLTRRKSAKREL
jgi:hypothetical protein